MTYMFNVQKNLPRGSIKPSCLISKIPSLSSKTLEDRIIFCSRLIRLFALRLEG